MDAIKNYLSVIPLYVLIWLALGAIFVVAITPRRLRLGGSLVFAVVWLTLSQLPEIGTIQAVAKMTSVLPFVLIGIAALAHPGPRRPIAPFVLLYPITALLGSIFVITTLDKELALVLRFQWLVLTISAILLVRVIVSDQMLHYVLRSITAGLCLAVLLPFSALVLDPIAAFRAGLGRFFPYDANPNQIGVLFVMATVLTTYYGIRAATARWKVVLFGFAGIAFAMGLVTGSRSVLVAMAFPLLPILFSLSRRPVFSAVMVTIALVGAMFVMRHAEMAELGRLTTLQTSRTELIVPYLQLISERPMFGLLGTTGERFYLSEDLGYAHNAYLGMLYMGGITYALPMFFIVAFALWSTYFVWKRRAMLANDPLLISTLAALMTIMFAHGMVNDSVFYPTYFWAYLHVVLAAMFITTAADLRRIESTAWQPLVQA